MTDSPERIAKRLTYQKSPEYKAKKRAYDAKRYQRDPDLRQKHADYSAQPEVKAHRAAYCHERYMKRKADPVAHAKHLAGYALRRRIRIYGTATPVEGQLSLDGLHRFQKNGPAPKPKPRKVLLAKVVRPPKPIVATRSVGVKNDNTPPVKPVAPAPRKEPWVPKPVGIDSIPPPRAADIYLCERPTCKRTFQTKFAAQRHFQKEHYYD